MPKTYIAYELTGEGKFELARAEWDRETRILVQLKAEYEISRECWDESVLAVLVDEHHIDCQEILCDIKLCRERRDHWETLMNIYAPIPF